MLAWLKSLLAEPDDLALMQIECALLREIVADLRNDLTTALKAEAKAWRAMRQYIEGHEKGHQSLMERIATLESRNSKYIQ